MNLVLEKNHKQSTPIYRTIIVHCQILQVLYPDALEDGWELFYTEEGWLTGTGIRRSQQKRRYLAARLVAADSILGCSDVNTVEP